jgi:hypothetical protein
VPHAELKIIDLRELISDYKIPELG